MPKTTAPKTAIVIGASTGIGAACVLELCSRGFKVAAVARRQSELEKVCAGAGQNARAWPHDVTRFEAAPALFEKIVSDLGGLGMIVYAAGVMPAIDVETYDFPK